MVRQTPTGTRDRIVIRTPAGMIGLSFSDAGITRIDLPRRGKPDFRSIRREGGPTPLADRVAEQLQRYFSGERVGFDIPLDIPQATAFQQEVWKAAAAIPYGETRSYAWIAKRIGRPRAARAVGQALGANPLPVLIPCHRVISSAGTLGGFSGGLSMKRQLLGLESRRAWAGARRKRQRDR
jgi:methylated-DNA-[protein]-cysteine S-methyltransferase